MTKLNTRKMENIKNVILVVLSLSTILLLYFFWWGASIDDINFTEQYGKDVPSIREVTQPDKLIICFGSDSYYMVPTDQKEIWDNNSKDKNSMVKELRKFIETENILKIEEITKKQYLEVMSYKSIQAEFSYSIPFSDFCKQYGIKNRQTGAIKKMNSIGYSEATPDSMFVSDGKNDKYYLLTSYSNSKHKGFSNLIGNIEKQDYDPYYPLGICLGVDNKTIIPISLKTRLNAFNANQELYVNETDQINKIAETFFGDSFDFIRKITEESGTIIYMYGYGEKTLIVNPDGTLEYKEKMNEENYVEQKYFQSLDTALQFVANHGSWNSANGLKMEPYVKSVTPISGKYKGYRITFGLEMNGGRIMYEKGNPIVVEVIGGQVTEYYRNIIELEKKDINNRDLIQEKEAFSAVNMIAQNYQYIQDVLKSSGKEVSTNEDNRAFEDIAQRISNVKVGYLRLDSKTTSGFVIKPVWVVTAEDINIYFDLYDAKPISYTGK